MHSFILGHDSQAKGAMGELAGPSGYSDHKQNKEYKTTFTPRASVLEIIVSNSCKPCLANDAASPFLLVIIRKALATLEIGFSVSIRLNNVTITWSFRQRLIK